MMDEVARLRAQIAARDRTIEVLTTSVENSQTNATTALGVMLRMSGLEAVVAERTSELATQKQTLEKTVDELRDMQSMLLQAQKLEAIGQLAAGVAHEINTPMQYIGDNARFLEKAFAELLAAVAGIDISLWPQDRQRKLGILRERVPRAIASTCEGVDAVSKIVRAMKEFSHPGNAVRAPFDLNHSVTSTAAVSRNEWKYAADLILDLAPTLQPVTGLQSEINQVLLNMLVNAAHAVADAHPSCDGAPAGKIWIRTWEDAAGVHVSVRDNGTGIPSTIVSRIFDPFFTTKAVGKGTGQGLAIAHSVVVDKHGGTIEAVSDDAAGSPMRGTTFTVTLPRGVVGSRRLARIA
ncbi:MAG: ATP-binding protein [Kofleriaceae bacterium]